MSCNLNSKKVAIIGTGFVGATTAFTLMMNNMYSEMVLIDADEDRAQGEAMDISHAIPYAGTSKVYAGKYDDISDASVIIITAGANQKPGESRLDLVNKNVGIYKTIIPEITKRNKEAILLVVSNPVDILTRVALELSGFPENRVIGSGTVLDTARLKYILGEHLKVDSKSIHAFIIGEHGDSELVAWSSASVAGLPMHQFCELRGYYDHDVQTNRIYENVKNSAYVIIDKKKATYFGVAMAVKRICEAILKNEHSILPVTCMLHGEYGIENTMLSVPAIVGENGVERSVPISLDEEEQRKLKASADTLCHIFEEIKF